MAGCDGWITIKILELLLATFCMIYKRVTDYEANRLFYFLQKFSREWPLLNNVTWEENGAIFTDITYGGYIIIIIGLIIGQCSGELQHSRRLENFFLIMGALLFIAAGSLELAALESVEERLVDNAAILGIFSLLTGFLFIIDLFSASKRRKRENIKKIQKMTQSKLTQTEGNKPSDILKTSDMNGNIQNEFRNGGLDMQTKDLISKNAVKLLPSSPVLNNNALMYSMEPPAIDGNDLKTPEGRIRSTESFLRSEKGFYPKIRKASEEDRSNNHFFIPTDYVLVPTDQLKRKSKTKSDSGVGDSPTPPGYAKIITDAKVKPGHIIIPIDQREPRKLQSPTVTTTMKGPQELYYIDGTGVSVQSSNHPPNYSNSSDVSDIEESRPGSVYRYEIRPRKLQKYSPEYLEMDYKGRKYLLQSEESSDEQKPGYASERHFQPDSRQSLKPIHGLREWRYYPKGRINESFADDKDINRGSFSRRNIPYRSSRTPSPEKPKSILRLENERFPQKEDDLQFLKDVHYDSLDSQKISEDLRKFRQITKSDTNLTRNLEKENKVLKERLKQEKEEKKKLKSDLEYRKKMEQQMKETEEEKDRRVSEREEQYFGIKDLKQSHKESRFDPSPEIKSYSKADLEKIGKGASEINESLKEKYLEHENKLSKELQEFRDVIDERFYFLDEEERRKKGREKLIPGEESSKTENILQSGKFPGIKKSDSDETNHSQSTEEEIRLRVGTPGSASYKSEALFWLGQEREDASKSSSPPMSPASPGYVLHTAQNWPESSSPQDRFHFTAKEAQNVTIGTPKITSSDRVKSDFSIFPDKYSQKSRLLEFEEVPDNVDNSAPKKSLLVRKVDFPNEPVTEIKQPTTVARSTSTWKRWLQPKPKLQHTRSVPN